MAEDVRLTALADDALLAALRWTVARGDVHVREPDFLGGPPGVIEQREVEGLAILIETWRAGIESPAPAVVDECARIRARIDGFWAALRESGLDALRKESLRRAPALRVERPAPQRE